MTIDTQNYDVDKLNVNFVTISNYFCRLCKVEFYFNNKLHRHVRTCRKERVDEYVNNSSIIESVKIFHRHFINDKILFVIESNFIIIFDVDLNFRK